MNFTISNKAYAKNVLNTLYKFVEDGKNYHLQFEEIKSLKTKKQLGFIFGGVIKAICMYFSRIGYDFTPAQIKQWLYDEIGVTETLYMPNGAKKQIIKTLSGMSKREASDFIYRLILFVDTSEALIDFILPPDLRYCWTNNIDIKLLEDVQQYQQYPVLSEYYLKHQRKLTCIRCGKKGGEVHHIKKNSGLGKKNPDWFTIPICRECHTYLHSTVGEPTFLNEIKNTIGNIDILTFCKMCYYMWFNNY
jgi:hypothetical protein